MYNVLHMMSVCLLDFSLWFDFHRHTDFLNLFMLCYYAVKQLCCLQHKSIHIQRLVRICGSNLVFRISTKLTIMNLDLPFDTLFVISFYMDQVKDKNLYTLLIVCI